MHFGEIALDKEYLHSTIPEVLKRDTVLIMLYAYPLSISDIQWYLSLERVLHLRPIELNLHLKMFFRNDL